jgi:hypothetical protein
MPEIRSKNSKIKRGLSLTPSIFKRQPTENATIPVWHHDGTLRYVTKEDFLNLANPNLKASETTKDQQS